MSQFRAAYLHGSRQDGCQIPPHGAHIHYLFPLIITKICLTAVITIKGVKLCQTKGLAAFAPWL